MDKRPLITDPKFWTGVTAPGNFCAAYPHAATRKDPVGPTHQWFDDIVPTYNQDGPSCVGQGWSNWLECMLRRYVSRAAIPDGCQLNAYAVWFKGRQMFYGGNLGGGLYLRQGFEAMKALGWIPSDCRFVEIEPDFGACWAALLNTPLVTAHNVTEGWFKENPENGCIQEDYDAWSVQGGHCTLRIACLNQGDRRFFAQLNSWGEERGWNGIYVMSEKFDSRTVLAPPATIEIPGGYERLAKCSWLKGVISTPFNGQSVRMP